MRKIYCGWKVLLVLLAIPIFVNIMQVRIIIFSHPTQRSHYENKIYAGYSQQTLVLGTARNGTSDIKIAYVLNLTSIGDAMGALQEARHRTVERYVKNDSAFNQTCPEGSTVLRYSNETLVLGTARNGTDDIKIASVLNWTNNGDAMAALQETRHRTVERYVKNDSAFNQTCPEESPFLRGRYDLDELKIIKKSDVTPAVLRELLHLTTVVGRGGHWRPEYCVAKQRVAIIVPYKDRRDHLILWLSRMHPFLQRQQRDYSIYVVEPYNYSTIYNKAQSMNAAYLLISKEKQYDCYIFHDVDMIAEDDRNTYNCTTQPKHLGVQVNVLGYRLMYSTLVGGVLAMTPKQINTVNGFSNLFIGYGGEDDEMYERFKANKMKLVRPRTEYAKYTMLKHTKRKFSRPIKEIRKLINNAKKRYKADGLGDVKYKLIMKTELPLYTHLLVNFW